MWQFVGPLRSLHAPGVEKRRVLLNTHMELLKRQLVFQIVEKRYIIQSTVCTTRGISAASIKKARARVLYSLPHCPSAGFWI